MKYFILMLIVLSIPQSAFSAEPKKNEIKPINTPNFDCFLQGHLPEEPIDTDLETFCDLNKPFSMMHTRDTEYIKGTELICCTLSAVGIQFFSDRKKK
jgi:hypothetical protein